MTVDLFTIRANDDRALGELIDILAAHCDTGEVEHFLADFANWHRLRGQHAKQHERDAAEIELRQWQQFINRLPKVTPE